MSLAQSESSVGAPSRTSSPAHWVRVPHGSWPWRPRCRGAAAEFQISFPGLIDLLRMWVCNRYRPTNNLTCRSDDHEAFSRKREVPPLPQRCLAVGRERIAADFLSHHHMAMSDQGSCPARSDARNSRCREEFKIDQGLAERVETSTDPPLRIVYSGLCVASKSLNRPIERSLLYLSFALQNLDCV